MIKYSVSILLPVINETFSLKQTVDIIASGNAEDIEEYIIICCERTKEESRSVIKEIQQTYGEKIVVLEQKLPFLGGALRDAFDLCRGTHVIMMASDLETDPSSVKQFIEESRNAPEMIITATRWKGGSLQGYNPFKRVLNYIFQKIFSSLYHVRLSDMTFGYRIFPSKIVKSIRWEEFRHPFLFETILKPLRLGVKVKEIPSEWKVRQEGISANTFFSNFGYFRTGIRVRFCRRSKLLKPQG
jgi:glycosyltransferase involved in cell wall biosynthesis